METKRDLILLVVKPFIITTFKLTCVRSFVRLEVRTLGVDLVASFGVALVYLAVLVLHAAPRRSCGRTTTASVVVAAAVVVVLLLATTSASADPSIGEKEWRGREERREWQLGHTGGIELLLLLLQLLLLLMLLLLLAGKGPQR